MVFSALDFRQVRQPGGEPIDADMAVALQDLVRWYGEGRGFSTYVSKTEYLLRGRLSPLRPEGRDLELHLVGGQVDRSWTLHAVDRGLDLGKMLEGLARRLPPSALHRANNSPPFLEWEAIRRYAAVLAQVEAAEKEYPERLAWCSVADQFQALGQTYPKLTLAAVRAHMAAVACADVRRRLAAEHK